jgi:hypothetical protein
VEDPALEVEVREGKVEKIAGNLGECEMEIL